jgi:predicted transposase YbfD/YdcC
VNAWCTAFGVSLVQVKTAENSNEIKAIPQILDLLSLKGAIVTADAMGCQKHIAEEVREKEDDYLLAVKSSHPTLYNDIKDRLDSVTAKERPNQALNTVSTREKGHGREETRTTWVLPAPKNLHGYAEWRGLKSTVMVEDLRKIDGKTATHHRFYISSLSSSNAQRFHDAVRHYWGVENGLHWVLDMAFREDECRIRMGHAVENMARLRQMALNLLKREKSTRLGIKNKRLRAGWDDSYLRLLLGLQRVEVMAEGANGAT